MPVDVTVASADRVLDTRPPLRRWRGPRGVRLVATDVDWARGEGTEVRGPVQEHLLTLTGRHPGTRAAGASAG